MSRSRRIVAIVCVLTALSPTAHASSAPTFERININTRSLIGEPRVYVDPTSPSARYFIVGNGTNQFDYPDTFVWWSTDGTHFAGPTDTGQAGGGNDSDLAIGPDHAVYSADLSDHSTATSIPIEMWDPSSHTFDYRGTVAPGQTNLDRQWIASPASGVVTAVARDANTKTLEYWISSDGGRTWTHARPISTGVMEAGALVTGPTINGFRSLYIPYYYSHGRTGLNQFDTDDIRVAKSVNGGRTWTSSVAATHTFTPLFPSMALDDKGGMYVAWQGSDPHPLAPVVTSESVIEFVASRDGKHWTKPVIASNDHRDLAHDVPVALFPWVAARTPGHVDITYAEEREPVLNSLLPPDFGGPETRWDLNVAQTLDALDAQPRFTRVTIAKNFHTGSICEGGAGCAGPQSQGVFDPPTPEDRRDLDFFGSAIDATGRLFIPYCQDRSYTTGNTADVLSAAVAIRLGRQTGGTTIP